MNQTSPANMIQSNAEWFREAKFGLFVHWGLYALPGGIWKGQETEYIGEWLQAKFRIPNRDYSLLAAGFNPVGFNAEEWVLTAKAAGMRYIVFTAKHHEGFAMYHSKCDSFNIVDATPFGRDALAELAEACQRHGIKLGLYYSQDLDWHHPDGGDPGPNFPENFGMSWANDWDYPDHSQKNFSRYLEQKVFPQLTELLTNYGPISLLWFDCPVNISAADSRRLYERVKNLQPDCMVNSRLGHGLGDYGSLGDNQLPAARRSGLFETPGTANDTWGFKCNDNNWKSPQQIINTLVSLAARDTNYLLNIGPGPDGRFPSPALELLKQVGRWLKPYDNTIYNSSGNPFPGNFEWGETTVSQSKNNHTKLNLFINDKSKPIILCGLNNPVLNCYEAAEKQPVPFSKPDTTTAGIELIQIDPTSLPDSPLPSVIRLELDTMDYPDITPVTAAVSDILILPATIGELRNGESTAEASGGKNNIGAAGEQLNDTGHSQLSETGLLVSWHNPLDSISWQVMFPNTGTYRLELVTAAAYHSNPWSDGQTVKITYSSGHSRQEQETLLKGKEFPSQPGNCYPEGSSVCGKLKIEQPQNVKITLSMINPGPEATFGLGLKELQLIKE